ARADRAVDDPAPPGPVQRDERGRAPPGRALAEEVLHAAQVAGALLADGRGEDDRAARDDPGRRERAGEGEEDGEAAAVVRDPGPAEPAIPAPDRHVGFRWEDRVQVRGNEDGRGFVDRWIGSG